MVFLKESIPLALVIQSHKHTQPPPPQHVLQVRTSMIVNIGTLSKINASDYLKINITYFISCKINIPRTKQVRQEISYHFQEQFE